MNKDLSCSVILGLMASAVLSACSSDATNQTVPDSAAAAQTLGVVVKFDATKFELPAGLAVRNGAAYAAFVPTGEVVKVDLASATVTPFGVVKPAAMDGSSFTAGITFDSKGDLYAAFAAFNPALKPGIYKIPAAGGNATLFASDPALTFPNSLVFDAKGDLFVTDSAAGSIVRITPAGAVMPFVTHDLLKGGSSTCTGKVFERVDVGANGIDLRNDTFYVTNTDKATVVAIHRTPDGAAGTPSILAGPSCEHLWRADGLGADVNGDLLVVSNKNRLVRVTPGGVVTTLAADGMLDFPSSVAVDSSSKAIILTNAALENGLTPTGTPPSPALLRFGGAK